MIIVYTGNGKGKTTAALGLALRNLGHGKKVVVYFFMKKFEKAGEWKFTHENFEKHFCGSGEFIIGEPSEEDKRLARECFEKAKKSLPFADLLILDEINVALHMNLIDLKEVLDFLKKVPDEKIVVLTGRYAPKEIIDIADLVTEMKEIKHPYQKGIPAREGVEW